MINSKPKYGNWIRVKIIFLLFFLSVLFFICGFIPWHFVFSLLMFGLSGLTLITKFIVVSVYIYFSPNGGDYCHGTFKTGHLGTFQKRPLLVGN